MRFRLHPACLATAALLITSCLTAACDASTGHTDHVDRSYFEPDQATYSLPLQAYFSDSDRGIYAARIFSKQCMAKFGVTLPALNPSLNNLPTRSKYGDVLFNEAIAARYGYHSGASRAVRPSAPTLTAREQSENIACQHSALAKFVQNPNDVATLEDMQNLAGKTAFKQRNVVDAEHRWRSCMTPLGLVGLPEDPGLMPTESQSRQFFRSDTTQPSPTEIQQAMADARCRESSRFSQISYETEVASEWALMDDHAEQLYRILASAKAVDEAATSYLHSNGI